MSKRDIANKMIEGARANLGVMEDGPNRGKWIEVYLASVGLGAGHPWCAAWCSYRYQKASKQVNESIKGFPKSAWTPDYEKWAKANNKWLPASKSEEQIIFRPKIGDLCCFYFENKKRIAHIGIVDKVSGRGVYVIAGNTSAADDDQYVERDGDGVFRKFYSYQSLGKFGGFVVMDDDSLPIKKAEIEKPIVDGMEVKIA